MNTRKAAITLLISTAIACVLVNSKILANEESENTPENPTLELTEPTEPLEPLEPLELLEPTVTTDMTESSDEDTSEKEATNDEVTETIALVNGKPISSLSLERVTAQLSAQGQNPDREKIIQELINLEILTQEAERLELNKSTDVAVALQLQYTQTMANAYLGEFNRDLRITEEEIRAKYDEQIAAIEASEFRASHILLETESDALNVIIELAEGSDFAVLAETYSVGPTGVNGGDLGWFEPANMEPEFSAALENLEVGDTSSEPVKTKFGWHVIQLVDSRTAAKPDYSPAVKAGIQNTILRDAMARKVDSLRSAATIEMQ